tara:strand:+ start:100 stop:438 length:339 start_codon:yes stop_codon:yes gene_type:complete
MAKAQRQKGLRNENKVKAMNLELGIPTARISAPYKSGPDLSIEINGTKFFGEVKARRDGSGWKTIKKWIENADCLYLVEDREQPLVCLTWDTYRRLVTHKEARDGPMPEMQP